MAAGSAGPSRRLVITGGTALLAAAASSLAGCTVPGSRSDDPGVGRPPAGPSTPPRSGSAAPVAPGTAPAGGARFDLSQRPRALLTGLELHESRQRLQGIAFDTVNRRLFLVQQRDGSPVDLCINQLSLRGRRVAHLHVDNAGHGQAVGVEPVGSTSYLWLEWGANGGTEAGRGTALARFPFVAGRAPRVRRFFAGDVEVGCAIDPVNRRLLIRRPEDGRTVYTLFDLRDGAPGAEVLARFEEPRAIYPAAVPKVLQAFTLLGGYAYTLIGTAGHAGTREDPFDSYLSAVDVASGRVVAQELLTVGASLPSREPEGLAVTTRDGAPQLVFGLASRHPTDRRRRTANLYVLDALV